jgi:hypothetical protein
MTRAITRLRLLGDSADELTKWQADVELRELEAKRKRERKEREAREQRPAPLCDPPRYRGRPD